MYTTKRRRDQLSFLNIERDGEQNLSTHAAFDVVVVDVVVVVAVVEVGVVDVVEAFLMDTSASQAAV